MNTKTKTTHKNYIRKLHKLNHIKLHILLFVKCVLITNHSGQIENVFIEANIHYSHGDPG